MQRVAVLSHVKASTASPSHNSGGVRRIAWQGGKISSNKVEALQKFYQRKLRAGDHLTAQQIKAMQATLGVELNQEQGRNNPKQVHATRRPQVKATASGSRTVLKTGRVLGPKIDSKQKVKKANGSNNTKCQAARQPKTIKRMPSKQARPKSFISVEDKLGLPLCALVEGNVRRNNNTKTK